MRMRKKEWREKSDREKVQINEKSEKNLKKKHGRHRVKAKNIRINKKEKKDTEGETKKENKIKKKR